ncbi:MAG: stage III sporulation protein AC [Christensenellaceae bacterium]|jgi:stage III sporulation protein AC|nr:stage III sporulation protein AC [Christensenellaceae bacterium]
MDVNIIFKIAGIGILASVICTILKHSGKDELATVVTLASVVICLLMVLDMINELFQTMRTLFLF